MSRRWNRKHIRFVPQLDRLEDRNPVSTTLDAILSSLGIASILDTSSLDLATPPSTSLTAVDPSYLTGSGTATPRFGSRLRKSLR